MDPSLEDTFKSLREAVNGSGDGGGDDERRQKLVGFLELEGLPANTPPEAYVAHMVRAGSSYGYGCEQSLGQGKRLGWV